MDVAEEHSDSGAAAPWRGRACMFEA